MEAADTWGLDGVWLGEMHFNPARSVLGAPIVVASSIATRTRRLRVGMAVQVLPLNNPLRIAEEAATVDQISAGRFDFGIGRSGSPRAYDLYGVPYAESQARFFEAFEIILRSLERRTLQLPRRVLSLRQRHRLAASLPTAPSAHPHGRHY